MGHTAKFEAGNKGTVLIVDDDLEIARLLAKSFASSGYEAAATASAAEALALVLDGDYDAVVTDIRLPRDDGLDLAARIHKYRPAVPVILMTGSHELAETPGLKTKAAALFEKPFSLRELLETVGQAIAARGARGR